MKTCPFCAEQVQDNAIKCRYCGSALERAMPVLQPATPSGRFETSLQFKKRSDDWFRPYALAGILAVVAISVLFLSSGGESRPRYRDDFVSQGTIAATLQHACKHLVEEQLKAPSTAEFQSPRDYTVVQTQDGYIVTGFVDAANSYGAKLRTRFTCVMDGRGDGSVVFR